MPRKNQSKKPFAAVEKGSLTPAVGGRYPLAEAARARTRTSGAERPPAPWC